MINHMLLALTALAHAPFVVMVFGLTLGAVLTIVMLDTPLDEEEDE